jgi:hypothetical protein
MGHQGARFGYLLTHSYPVPVRRFVHRENDVANFDRFGVVSFFASIGGGDSIDHGERKIGRVRAAGSDRRKQSFLADDDLASEIG